MERRGDTEREERQTPLDTERREERLYYLDYQPLTPINLEPGACQPLTIIVYHVPLIRHTITTHDYNTLIGVWP